MNNTLTIFNSLPGKWKFKRNISGFGWVKGIANFESMEIEKESLFYKEAGILNMDNGSEVKFFKEYVYCYKHIQIKVFFVENDKINRLFHILSFDHSQNTPVLKASAIHLCINDTYKASYNFLSDKKFKLTYKVTGPHKDYISVTVFEKDNE